MKIDKSLFTAEERAQYEALIAKAVVDTEAAEEEMEEEIPTPEEKKKVTEEAGEEMTETEKCSTRKSLAAENLMKSALNRLENLEKSIEMKEFTEIAKRYAPLGEKEEDLAQTLYDMKKSNEDSYNAYINILEKSLGLVEKSGIFTEIGKSTSGGMMSGGTVDKVESIAQEIMKSDTDITREQAIAKAWESHPELIAEYESEYKR